MNVRIEVAYGENRDGLPESAEVEWSDAVDQPDTSILYAVLALLMDAARRRDQPEVDVVLSGDTGNLGPYIAAAAKQARQAAKL